MITDRNGLIITIITSEKKILKTVERRESWEKNLSFWNPQFCREVVVAMAIVINFPIGGFH